MNKKVDLNGITIANIGKYNPLRRHSYSDFFYIDKQHNLITLFGRALELYRFFNEHSIKNLLRIVVNSEVEKD
ncbi:4491_t:CDS:2 [Gigaspora margarita]|uniref:4491_t:CDS:1 n=1 Tax=Gigaspora margarita TaxID=4874 RepID=A0ABN7UB75_GIGMA|nr:4491_t:CDS:2 [Gigaspora margarita]